jgi:hypothetical protein
MERTMSPFKVSRQIAEVGIVFSADQPAAGAPFYEDNWNAFMQRFKLKDGDVEEDVASGGLFWSARKGRRSIGERAIVLEAVRGNENSLGVAIVGNTDDALDMITEVWSELCALEGVSPDRLQSLGTLFYSTIAVVEMPCSFEDLFPLARKLTELTSEGMKQQSARAVGSRQLQFTMDMPIFAGNLIIPRPLVIKPHVTSSSDRVLYTQSPLNTTQHTQLLEQLCAQTMR